APTYRKKYAEFLKTDFPHVPFTKKDELFLKLSELGKRLAGLHLLKSNELDTPIAKFHGSGDNSVEKIKYEKDSVFINPTQYFDSISESVWNYHIGGYKVCAKWLKDRKGRKFSVEEIKTYCRIVTALSKTMEIQKEIDKIYPKIEKKTLRH
nr:DNA methyltransferase [Candidatus Neomarinimicrobiota bacterium]